MTLLQQVQAICARLAPLGWQGLLERHGLNLQAADLAAELAKPLKRIDRLGVPGFADFHADAVRAIEPGNPAMSLLYHALASPGVHPTSNGLPAANLAAYPTLEELDTLENYIYAKRQLTLSAADLAGMRVVVFAYQYRTAARTGHGLYADLTYSRTGVARVGTVAAAYNTQRRSFWPIPATNPRRNIAAMGARYGAFLAVAKRLSPHEVMVGGLAGDADGRRNFWVPQHKLFAGSECLGGLNLTMDFGEFHLNEKLRRVHLPTVAGTVPMLPGFDINEPPFVRTSKNSTPFVQLQPVGAGSVQVLPVTTGKLVETATQLRQTTNKNEIVRYVVPAVTDNNRYPYASFQIAAPESGLRFAPEYVNMRHEVDVNGHLNDLNQLPQAAYRTKLDKGGYEAAHFLDHSADGCIGVKVKGLPPMDPPVAAYSLVTAPDFLPLVDQTTIFAWAQELAGGEQTQFAQGRPWPLSQGRWAANPAILQPDTTSAAFDPTDETMTAVLNIRQLGTVTSQLKPPAAVTDASVSYLPDASANVFAPGWDVSLSGDINAKVFFLTSFGLGSPFPEDAKLCAALNSFWPAAAPDAARTFGHTTLSPTAQPLLDEELGYHPQHPLVQNHTKASRPGWDGEFGPFFETVGNKLFVNYANLNRSDYVTNALAGLFHLSDLGKITAEEMIGRMEALRACIRHLPGGGNSPSGNTVSSTPLFMVQAEAIAEWSAVPQRFDSRLSGAGYRYVFVDMQANGTADPNDMRRVRRQVSRKFECQLAMRGRRATLLVFDNGPMQHSSILNP
jgi:hypothetical protein